MNERQIKYQCTKVSHLFQKYKNVENKLHKLSLHVILQQSIFESMFDSVGVILPQEIVPTFILLAGKSREICHHVLPTSSHTKQNARHLSVQLAIDVAKLEIYNTIDLEMLHSSLVQFHVHFVMQNKFFL